MKKFFITGMFLCFLLFSCNKDREIFPDKKVLSLKFSVVERLGGKAVPIVNESELSDIHIIFYDNTGKYVTDRYIENPVNEVITLNVCKGDEYSVYAIANSGKLPPESFSPTVNEIRNRYWYLDNAYSFVNLDGAIPMSGYISNVVLSDKSVITIELRRILSKFRVKIDTSGLDKDIQFDLKKVTLKNLNRKIYYFSESKALLSEDVLETGGSREGAGLENIFHAGLDFFLPENMQGNLLHGNNDEITHIPPSPYNNLCSYIEFSVDYRSPVKYDENLLYRYYIHDGNRLDNFDVLRNTLYYCTTGFVGDGINENSWRIDISGMKDLVTSIIVIPSSHEFYTVGESKKFEAEVLPVTAENINVTWTSSDERVAKVAQDGTVTAIGEGQCQIIATSCDDTFISGYADIYVKGKTFSIIDFPDIFYPNYNTPYNVEYMARPEGMPAYTISTINGDPNAVRIENGRITAVNNENISGEIGNYELTAELNGITLYETFQVNAGEVIIDTANVSNVYLGKTYYFNLKSSIPRDVGISWTVDNPDVADIVPQSGEFRPVREGSVQVKATSVTGTFDEVPVNVGKPYLDVTDVQSVYEGETVKLQYNSVQGLPITIELVSGGEHISIDQSGYVTGLKRTLTGQYATVRIYYNYTNPLIEGKIINVIVLPAVSASLQGNDNKLLNISDFPSTRVVKDYPAFLNISFSHSPKNSISWRIYDSDWTITEDIGISSSGTVEALKNANGIYHIVGLDGNFGKYFTDTLDIKVYKYMGYLVGLVNVSSTIEEGGIIYVYSMESKWHDSLTPFVFDDVNVNPMRDKMIIGFPETATMFYPVATYMAGTKNFPNEFVINYEEVISYNPENSQWDDLVPRSWLKTDDGIFAGLTGVACELMTEKHFYYIRQESGEFYNNPSL